MMLVVKISPSFFIHHRPSMHARGCGGGGRMEGEMAVGQVEDDAMIWGNEVSSFLVFA
jgi:hypothetical protein